jgi:hypothetical protein
VSKGSHLEGAWIGVDFDGTLAHYEGAHHYEIGGPIKPMVERVKRWLKEGYTVKIFTARVFLDGTRKRRNEALAAKVALGYWCLEHLGQVLEVTCQKDFKMIELWDDRAVTVERNTGYQLGVSQENLE